MALFDVLSRLSCPYCGKKEFILHPVKSISASGDKLIVYKTHSIKLECATCGIKLNGTRPVEKLEYAQEE